MKTCKCEHWQQCPVCMPHRFDGEGKLLPPEPTPLQAARNETESLRQQLANREKQIVMLRDELLRVKGICLREVGIGIVNEVVLADTSDLDQFILCKREPVAAQLMVRFEHTGWKRYNVYDDLETANWHAAQCEGDPLLLMVDPLYAAAEAGK